MSIPVKASSASTDVIHNHVQRLLNWENAKNSAKDTYNGVKSLVLRNIILSSSVGVVVICLFILCCYLRRKYSRNAQVMSRRQHAQMLEQRDKRREENENNCQRNRTRKMKKKREEALRSSQDLVNTSFETRATILSDTDREFKDIENDGVEMKLDVREKRPITGSKDQAFRETEKTSRLKRFFGRDGK